MEFKMVTNLGIEANAGFLLRKYLMENTPSNYNVTLEIKKDRTIEIEVSYYEGNDDYELMKKITSTLEDPILKILANVTIAIKQHEDKEKNNEIKN